MLAAVWGTVCAAVVAAPVLSLLSLHAAACAIYLAFSCICHQIPERSFALFNYPLPVCHRCAGLYLGMLLGSFFRMNALHRSARSRRICIAGTMAAMLLDAAAPAAGLWAGAPAGRFATGLLFGIVIASVLVRGLAEFLREAPWRRLPMHISLLKGGLQ